MDEHEALTFEPNSLGELLGDKQGGALVGVAASEGPLQARVTGAAVEPLVEQHEDHTHVHRFRVKLFLEAEKAGQKVPLESSADFHVDTFFDAFQMRAPQDAAARVQATLAKLVALGDLGALQDLLRQSLDALMPAPGPNSFLEWLERDALKELQPEGHLARYVDDEVELVARATKLEVEHSFRSFGAVKLQLEVAVHQPPGGAPQAVFSQEVFTGGVSTESPDLPRPDLKNPEVQGVVERWRSYFAHTLKQGLDLTEGQAVMPNDALPETSIISLLEDWVAEGPPGPAPERIHVTDEVRARTAKNLRPCTEEEKGALQEFLEPELTAAYFLEGYILGICQGETGDDWLVLREKTADPILLLRSDELPDSRAKFTIDGDGWAMRNLLAWLGQTLRTSGHDFNLTLVLEDEALPALDDDGAAEAGAESEEAEGEGEGEEAESAEGQEAQPTQGDQLSMELPLSVWLRFTRGYHPDEPCFDWRRPNDLLVDGRPYWDAQTDLLPEPEELEVTQVRGREVPAFYRFIRRVLDAEFVGALEPRN